jgi:SSS family solute:Na+ symporter
MLAAAMQTCSAALNSSATLFAYDIWKRWRPATSDLQLVRIGRWTTVTATLLAIVLSPIFGHYNTIIQGLTTLICYVAPPITCVFLIGVFWRGAGGRAAFLTMIAGATMGAICFVADFYKDSISGPTGFLPPDSALTAAFDWFARGVLSDFMLTSFGMFCLCVLIQIVASLRMPEPLKAEARLLVWDSWREPLRGEAHGHGMGNYRILTGVVLVTFVALYAIFR